MGGLIWSRLSFHILPEAGFGLPCLMALELADPPPPPIWLSSFLGWGPRELGGRGRNYIHHWLQTSHRAQNSGERLVLGAGPSAGARAWGRGRGGLAGGWETGVKGRVTSGRGKQNWGGGLGSSLSLPPPAPRYYHTLFTHSLPKALRRLAEAAPPCVDVLMNFLVAAATKLPPIKVPSGRRHEDASPPRVRMEGAGRHRGETGGRAPSHRPTGTLSAAGCGVRGRGWVRKDGKLRRISPPILGAWGPGARSPGLHRPGGGGVRPHAPGVLSPPSGPSAL